jgi:RNA recognition motif-containing protein
MEIFFANAPFAATYEQLLELFSQFGFVDRLHLCCDRDSGVSRGFGFVEMPHDREALLAIQQLDKRDLDGRRIAVRQANERRQPVGR